MNELFWTVKEADRLKGYTKVNEHFCCLICDQKTEEGYIYPKGDLYLDAKKQMQVHIEEEHGGVFNYLLGLDKKVTGLSDHQRKIMELFYKGYSDFQVKDALNVGSVSTIRNHRHMLKEKEKQSKTIITMMTLLSDSMHPKNLPLKPHETATMVDKRYDVSLEDSVKALEKYFPEGTDGPLKTFSVKEKYKLIILREVIKRFDYKVRYTEKEVDTILKAVYKEDHVVLRRYLIEYGFMAREKDCSAYWRKETVDNKNMKKKEKVQSKRKALVQAYMAKENEKGTISGVYQIKNLENGKVYISSARNVSKLNGVAFQLNMGTFTNKALQSDWKKLGEDKFEIAVLDSFEESEDDNNTKKLKELERSIKENLQPYGDKGYHKKLKR